MYIYIHIPFCSNICNYCDFPKCLYNKRYISSYLKELKKEIQTRYLEEEVTSIYIGGGTPTCLDCLELEELLKITNIFHQSKNIEFTIESNIENLDRKKIKLLKKYHVNRISLGVQSFQKDVLQELNRHHTKKQVFQVIKTLRIFGITNISIDYIYGINANLKQIEKDLDTFFKLDLPHISCYSLMIEENTVFGINHREYIDEEIEYQMYQLLEKKLKQKGYFHYEVSNYAKEGYQSRHNLNYWNNGEYYGFGLGAVSYLNQKRISNTKNLSAYLNGKYQFEVIPEAKETQISNTFILGLRLVDGIDIREFKKKYQKEITEIEPVFKLLQEGLLVLDNEHLKIPPSYFYLSNAILIYFV